MDSILPDKVLDNNVSERAVSVRDTAVDLSSGKAGEGYSSTEKTEVVHLSTEKAENTHLSPQKTIVRCLSVEETDQSA